MHVKFGHILHYLKLKEVPPNVNDPLLLYERYKQWTGQLDSPFT